MSQLHANKCPLCEYNNISRQEYLKFGRGNLYTCPNCGEFAITELALKVTAFEKYENAKSVLSHYIRNHQDENPILTRESIQEILNNEKLPSMLEQCDKLLNWFYDKSKSTIDAVDGNINDLPALIGARNKRDVVQLLDELWNKKFIEMENPTTGPLRGRASFDHFCGHLTLEGIRKIENNRSGNEIIDFNVNQNIEELLNSGENDTLEFKGSFELDINRLIKGDKKRQKDIKIADGGVLKTIVAFLNSQGGGIIIGALEKNKFRAEEIFGIEYSENGKYYLIGIDPESNDTDSYELNLRNKISSKISKELGDMLKVSFPTFNRITLCHIVVGRAKHKWYYLNNEFFVRDGNRTLKLEAEEADNYKNQRSR